MTTTGWQSVRDEVHRRIAIGRWPAGTLLPTETVLAAEFGCARATVNRALRELAAAGMLDRRRRAGTRVAASSARRATLAITVLREEIEARGQAYGFRVTEAREAPLPDHVAVALGVAAPARATRAVTLHFADAKIQAYEDRWLFSGAGDALDGARATAQSLNEWLVAHVPVTRGQIACSAEPAPEPAADALGVPAGTALFTLERVTWSGESPVTHVTMRHAPGYRMRLIIG